jgi:hypothetical protein
MSIGSYLLPNTKNASEKFKGFYQVSLLYILVDYSVIQLTYE